MNQDFNHSNDIQDQFIPMDEVSSGDSQEKIFPESNIPAKYLPYPTSEDPDSPEWQNWLMREIRRECGLNAYTYPTRGLMATCVRMKKDGSSNESIRDYAIAIEKKDKKEVRIMLIVVAIIIIILFFIAAIL